MTPVCLPACLPAFRPISRIGQKRAIQHANGLILDTIRILALLPSDPAASYLKSAPEIIGSR